MNRPAHHTRRNQRCGYSVVWMCLVGLGALAIIASVQHESRGGEGSAPTAEAAPESAAGSEVFQEAGVCARCHVFSVVEWAVSGHLQAQTNCQSCHGESDGHVADERNEVKPDRVFADLAVTGPLCMTCHDSGCPNTEQVANCRQCHHVHALIDPTKPPAEGDEQVEKLLQRWEQFNAQMAKGQAHVERQQWEAACVAYRAALNAIPGHAGARAQLAMCRRRLQPALPGFERLDAEYDAATGLPRAVKVSVIDMPMRLVPPGEFDLGSDRWPDSRPVHTVRIDAFFLGACEVTQAQWSAVMGSNPAGHQGEQFPDAARMPVERVSWEDCQAFLQRLNERIEGGGFRLPTEAEWEYACRAGGASKLEADDLVTYAWFRANSRRSGEPDSPLLGLSSYAPRAVGTRAASPWGLHDMQGNVREWCSSLWRPYLYNHVDGREALTGAGLRVLRGGAYCDSASAQDPASRQGERPGRRLRFNGLRLARSVPDLRPLTGED